MALSQAWIKEKKRDCPVEDLARDEVTLRVTLTRPTIGSTSTSTNGSGRDVGEKALAISTTNKVTSNSSHAYTETKENSIWQWLSSRRTEGALKTKPLSTNQSTSKWSIRRRSTPHYKKELIFSLRSFFSYEIYSLIEGGTLLSWFQSRSARKEWLSLRWKGVQ